MTMIANASRYDWSTWAIGIARSGIAGGAGAVSGIAGPMYTDPDHFNFGPSGLKHTLISMGIGALIAGIGAMATFLKTHSAPDPVAPTQAPKP